MAATAAEIAICILMSLLHVPQFAFDWAPNTETEHIAYKEERGKRKKKYEKKRNQAI